MANVSLLKSFTSDSELVGITQFWNDLEAAYNWKSFERTEGEENFENFYVTDNIYIHVGTYPSSSYSGVVVYIDVRRTTETGRIEYRLIEISSTFQYQFITSSTGDFLCRFALDGQMRTQSDGLFFGIFDMVDVVENQGGIKGVYVPLAGNKYAPRLLVTEDTEEMVTNSGTSGSLTNVLPEAVFNTQGKISFAIPLAAMSSQCITSNARILQISPNLYHGYVSLNGENYYAVGLLLFPEQ